MQNHFSTLGKLLAGALCICSLLMALPAARAGAGEQGEVQPADLTELSLQDLMNVTVHGASKFDQKLSEAPSSVTIITADEIKKYGYRTLADALRSVRGFLITNDRNYSYVSVRGFGRTGDWNSRILVLVDGHRMNEITYDSVYVGNEAIIDIDLVDRIEIIRGPGSSLYGSNAFFAVINITTRKGRDIMGAEASGEAGTFNTYKGRITYGSRYAKGNELLISGTGLDSDGNTRLYFPEYDTPTTNNGVAENLDYEKHRSLFAKYAAGDVTLSGAYVGRTKGVPTASFGAEFNDPRYLTRDERAYLDLKYERPVGSGVDLLARVFYDQYWYHADFPYFDDTVIPGGAVVLNRDFAWANWWGTEAQVIKTLAGGHKIVAGAEFQDNVKARFENHNEPPFYYQYIDINPRSRKWAAYLQDEARLSDRLIVNAGVRYDHYETFGGTTNPRAALIYHPAERSTIKLLGGTAFRSPNMYELYFDSPSYGIKGNPDLKPEKITTYEVVYEQYLGDHVLATLAGFQNHISNWINQIEDTDLLLVYRNFEGVRAKGLETELEGRWDNGVRNRVSYTYTYYAKDLETGGDLANSPKHMVKANLILPVQGKTLFADAEVQFMSDRKAVDGSTVPGFVVANLTLFSQGLMKNLDLSGSVYNLFDRKYGHVGGEDHLPLTTIEQDGRTYRVKLTYRF